MILAANHVNDYLDARVCHSLQKKTTQCEPGYQNGPRFERVHYEK